MSCPPGEKLELFYESALDEPESAELRAHLLSCGPCGDHMRRLDVEADLLRNGLPDAGAPPEIRLELKPSGSQLWKGLAAAAAVVAIGLGALLFWNVKRQDEELTAARRNIEQKIAFHLKRGEPDKAAAALQSFPVDIGSRRARDAARLEIANASTPGKAALLLDAINLAGLDRDTAERVAHARVGVYRKLFEDKVLEKGKVPAPYEPEPYRMKKPGPTPAADMTRIVARLRTCIAESLDLAQRYGSTADPALKPVDSLARIVQYALGEISFASVQPTTDEARFRFGELLYRERQFDRAIDTWKPLLDDKRVLRKLAELAALRRFAPEQLHVWDYDVEKLLGRDAKIEAEAAAYVKGMFREAQPGTIEWPEDLGPRKVLEVSKEAYMPTRDEVRRKWITADPDQLYVLFNHTGFRMDVPATKPFTTRSGATVMLESAYRGPIRARLFRAPDMKTLASLDETNFIERRAELKPVREWEVEFESLSKNRLEAGVWDLDVPHKGAGLYVLVADARYCPVFAVANFIITDVALVQQVARDGVLVFAADRMSGAPTPDLPLEAKVTGRFVLTDQERIPPDDSNVDEYRRGFDAAWSGKEVEKDTTPSYLLGYDRGEGLRMMHPDQDETFSGKTDGNGLFEWKAGWRSGYRYTIQTVTAHDETYSRVESSYTLDARRELKALVYTDRPLYRPGDEVSFKAILRHLDGEGLHVYDDPDVYVEFKRSGRVYFSGTFPVGELGTADGEFQLPADCEQGSYTVTVNNVTHGNAFTVESYRKPEFEILLNHPREVRAGRTVEFEVHLRYYTGDPVANTPVELNVVSRPVSGGTIPEDVTAGWFYKAAVTPGQKWRSVKFRVLKTDARGRCVLRVPTDEGIAARYALTAWAQDSTRRRVTTSSSFETTADGADIRIETDRPTYFPGETATIRFHVDGTEALRIEERIKKEDRYVTRVRLHDGAGFCSYPVPDKDRSLQIGVRVGDAWSWTPVPLRIAPKSVGGNLVDVHVDRAVYRIGETATLTVRTREPDQHVLITVATGRIHERRVVLVPDKTIEVPMEIAEDHVPNIGIVATALRADRLGRAQAQLIVPPVDRFLTVEISTNKPEYAPGEECEAEIRVVDWKGRPVPDCEISLGVVDEAIFALQKDTTPDLREYFHRYKRAVKLTQSFFFTEKPGTFILWKAPTFVRGMMNVYDIIGGGAGGGGRYGGRMGGKKNLVAAGGGGADTFSALRADFRDTAFWAARLRTEADGIARAKFNFPANLTRFRFTARGVTRDHKVGEVRQNAVVRKDFFTRLALPRVLQEGNEIAVSGLVHNYTKESQSVRLAFQSPYPVVFSSASVLELAPGEVGRVEYHVSADRYLPEVEFSFKAVSETKSDGLTVRVPGRRHGRSYREGRSGSVASGVRKDEVFRVPAGRIPGTVQLKLNLDAGIHTAVIEGLEPLIQYPYGCVEQTMSRFLPAVSASRALGKAPNRWSEKLPSVIASSLVRLYRFQHGDGGWGWWEKDKSNDVMTAYVLYGLAVCRKAGVGVDRKACSEAAAFIRKHLEGRVKQREGFT